MLCAAGLFAIFSSTISKSPVLPLFATHLGADPSQVGMVAAISAFTGVLFSLPAGFISDKVGRKSMLVCAAIIFATAPFLYLIVTNIWQLAAVRFFHGFSTAIFIPVGMAVVSGLYKGERGEKIGWFSSSTLIGRFMAPIFGGMIISFMAATPALAFRYVYLLCAAAGIIALGLVINTPITNPALSAQRSWAESFAAFRVLIAPGRGILSTSAVEAAILFSYGTFETFIPLYAMRLGISAAGVGALLSAQVITLALSKPVMGRFSDRHGRPPQIAAGAVLGALCIGAFPYFTSYGALLITSVLFGLSLSIVTSATSAYIGDLSADEAHGSAMGILGSVMDIGHTTGPLVAGLVAATLGYRAAFSVGAGLLVVMSAVFWTTRPDGR